ncbi:glycosyl transferase family 2 [Nibricoccus aquaticus]|uniref:Glycosyl transferase family 2 n=1 Tax=Nibricoccus aquaticus TaxID=2576891 RepID=A0A290QB99_9BACT|nr:glycosyltransferase family 2 protein [Nibricoccus aquaticus]ATC62588.1 glycosyl transferase family 2 [Nibricoccus aquaticus]
MTALDYATVHLSVIIVTYRSEGEIGDCLESIPRRLTGGEVEIIVVDNSPDVATAEVVAKRFPEVALMRTGENLGFGRANNRGFYASRGEYVLFLNPDTVSNVAAFEMCVKTLRERPRAGVVSPRLVMGDGKMDLASRRGIPTLWDGLCRASGLAAAFPRWKLVSGYNLTYLDERGTYAVGSVNGAFLMTSRSLLEKVGLFDESFFMYGEDLDFCHRFTLAGYEVVFIGSEMVVHLKGASSSRETAAMSREFFEGSKTFFLKHFNPHGSRWVKLKYDVAFGLWESWARMRRWLKGSRKVRPA